MAYVSAVAAYAGMSVTESDYDYGIDGTFNDLIVKKRRDGKRRFVESGFKIDFQLKSTINIVAENGVLKYDLEVKNYEDLIDQEVGTERILLLFVLPKNQKEWLEISETELKLKRAAWWYSLKGKPCTKNRNRIRIEIPETQLLTPEELKRIMAIVKNGGAGL